MHAWCFDFCTVIFFCMDTFICSAYIFQCQIGENNNNLSRNYPIRSFSWSIQDGPLSLAPGCMDLEWPAGLSPVQEWDFSLILQFLLLILIGSPNDLGKHTYSTGLTSCMICIFKCQTEWRKIIK